MTITVGPRTAQAQRPSTPLRQALLFLLVGSPFWLVPGLFAVANAAVMLVIVAGITLLFLWKDGQPPSELGLEPAWRRAGELAGGFAGGALLVGAISVGAWAALPFPWAFNPGFEPRLAAWSLVWLLCGNGVEELVFRGYSFDRLIRALGIWRAQLLTALLFAGFHLVNGWPWPAALIGTTSGSLLFGFVFIRWRSVPAAIGVHAAANWVRDLLLVDPPAASTLFAPLAPRPWTPAEQLIALLVFTGVTLFACALIWFSDPGRRRAPGAHPGS